jgi:hypothetical protein
MSCRVCHSDLQGNFNGELGVHFPGRAGLTKPLVWVFPKLAVCMNCGVTEFVIPQLQLYQLKEDAEPSRDTLIA